MILVNNPGTWANLFPAMSRRGFGCTPTDLVFLFPFMVERHAFSFPLLDGTVSVRAGMPNCTKGLLFFDRPVAERFSFVPLKRTRPFILGNPGPVLPGLRILGVPTYC